MPTKYELHKVNRKALLERCAKKAFLDGYTPENLIQRSARPSLIDLHDLKKAMEDLIITEGMKAYKELMKKAGIVTNAMLPKDLRYGKQSMKRIENLTYVAVPTLTPEAAIKALCIPNTNNSDVWVSSYLHENLKRLKRLRNRPHMHRGVFESYLTEQVRKYVGQDKVDKAVRVLMRWIYPKPTERDYFYPTTYAELRRGRVSTYAAGGGRLYSTEYIDIVGRHPSEIEAIKPVIIKVD